MTPARSDEMADSPRRRESEREKKLVWGPSEGEWDTQQWHANPLGWWLAVGGVGKAEMKWWEKKKSWQLFDACAVWLCVCAVPCKWQQLCQSGGIRPTRGRVMGDYALMLWLCLDRQRDGDTQALFDIHLMRLFIRKFTDTELETLWWLDQINSFWK